MRDFFREVVCDRIFLVTAGITTALGTVLVCLCYALAMCLTHPAAV